MTYNRIISRKAEKYLIRLTYKTFMKKYKMPLMIKKNNKYIYKTMLEMSEEIYDYEKNNDFITSGLYYF
jgi:hypothetical protein